MHKALFHFVTAAPTTTIRMKLEGEFEFFRIGKTWEQLLKTP